MAAILRVRDNNGNVIEIPAIVGPAGETITSFQRTSGTGAPGTDDTYTVTTSAGKKYTFTVYNGKDGGLGEEDVRAIVEAEIEKIPAPDVSGQINTHNSDEEAHADIRQAVTSAANAAAAAQQTANSKEASGTAASAVSAHNTNTSAHSDIRTAVSSAASAASAAQTAANNAASAAAAAQTAANNAQTTANSKASTATYTVSVPTGWTADGAGGYYKTVAVSGMLASDNPIADVVLGADVDANAAYIEAWSLVTRISTAANSITLYANGDAPATAFTVQLKAVR